MSEPNKEVLKKLDEHLTCAICLDHYKDPKLLQCFHIFCEWCLVRLVVQDRQGQLSVRCPTCRRSTILPATSVSGLQPAFHIHHLFEIQDALGKTQTSRNLQCEKCFTLDPVNVVTASNFCRTCGHFICAMYEDIHAECRAHQVFSVERLKDDELQPFPPKKTILSCPFHKERELELYCETCEELICFHCTVKTHNGHQYDLVSKVFEKHKSEITASLEPVETQLGTVNKALEQLDTHREQITDQRAAIEANIHKTFQCLHEALDVRRTELIGQLNLMTQRKLKNLATQRDEIEMVQTQLNSCVEFVRESLTRGSQGEVLSMKKRVVTQIKKLTSDFKPDALKTTERANMRFSAASVSIQQLGKVDHRRDCPEKCYVSMKNMQAAIVEEKTTAIVHVVDEHGEACVVPVESVNCELVSEITGKKKKCSTKQLENSRYEISYQPTTRGRHQLHIKVEGEHIKGSPFPVMVKKPVEKLGTPIKIIDGLERNGPWGVAVNQRGEIIVVEHRRHCVSIFSPSGDKLRTFGSYGSGHGKLNHPCGVAVDDDGNILVVDGLNHHIQKFTSDGQFVKTVGKEGGESLQFCDPVGIAIHPHNKKVYVADRSNHRIQILNPDLTFSSMFGSQGSANGQFYYPWDVAFDNTGNVYVVDVGNHRIQVFTAEGAFFLRKFGKRGQGDGELNWPSSVAIDSDNVVYVTERNNQRVSVFSSEGKFLTSFGTKGNRPGQFHMPCGITVNKSRNIYISDHSNGRIQDLHGV